jgi:hypothetical protein
MPSGVEDLDFRRILLLDALPGSREVVEHDHVGLIDDDDRPFHPRVRGVKIERDHRASIS